MKYPHQIKTAPLNRATDLIKTAREINAPHVAEIHMVGGGAGADAIGELFKDCGWLVVYHPDQKSYGKSKRGETSVLGHRNKSKHRPKLARRAKSKH